MKANDVLNLLKISRPTLTKYVKLGYVKTTTLPNGRYSYDDKSIYDFLNKEMNRKTIIYARVSIIKQKKDLENQINLLKQWCFNKGYSINEIKYDIASGINFENRKELFNLINDVIDGKIERIIITYKDRLSRIGFELFKVLFEKYGTNIEVISEIGNPKLDSEEIFEEIVTLLHSYSMKLYSNKRKNLVEELCQPE
jgi:predicted site-specific integrase-resolvase